MNVVGGGSTELSWSEDNSKCWEARVSYTGKIDDLVQTVRHLNWEVRPKIDNTPGGNPPGNPLFQALADIRNHEIQHSQLIRGMSLTEVGVEKEQGRVVEHIDASEIGARQLLSEFATAREAILSLLRTFSAEQWSEKHDTFEGNKSIEQIVDGLIESDKSMIERISSAVS